MSKEIEAKNFYYRILFISITSVVLSHSLHLKSPVYIAIMASNMVVAMRNYVVKSLVIALASMFLGMLAGFMLTEIFPVFPMLQVLLTYTIFLTAVKFFSHNYLVTPSKLFIKGYALASVSASYLSADYEVQIKQAFVQFVIAFILLTIAFKLFPGNGKSKKKNPPLEKSSFKNYEVYYFAFIMTAIWTVYMLFRFDFANIAIVTLFSIFIGLDIEEMKDIAGRYLIGNFIACFITAIFSILMFGLIGNILLYIFGLLVVLAPFAYYGVYKGSSLALLTIPRFMTPMSVYLNTEGAAVYKVSLRYTTIICLMLTVLFFLNLLPKSEKYKEPHEVDYD